MGTELQVLEPATEQVLTAVDRTTVEELDETIARATSAARGWRSWQPGRRADALRRIADAIEENLELLAELESRNVGKPIEEARGEVGMAVATFRYFSGMPERPFGETIPVPGGHAYTVREPLGVVGLITPWNFPLAIAVWKIAPALAAGNAVVLKPAELTPLTAIELGRIAIEAGLPEDVLNVVVGPGSTIGERLASHPDIAKLAFTGSTAVGARVAATAAAGIKRVTLELGGKSANIVFADSDVEAAAAAAPSAAFANAGQDCCARSRILVEASALDRFLEHVGAAVTAIKVGDPLDEATEMGPLVSAARRQTVASFLDGDDTVAIQGEVPEGPGFWFPPTVLCPVDRESRAVREEIFGPIAAVIPFEGEAEAVRLANDTIYGLSGSIWTKDIGRALRVTAAVEAGNLSVNSNSSVRVTTPFGGFKQSGYGRELGPHATDAYTEVKTVFISTQETR